MSFPLFLFVSLPLVLTVHFFSYFSFSSSFTPSYFNVYCFCPLLLYLILVRISVYFSVTLFLSSYILLLFSCTISLLFSLFHAFAETFSLTLLSANVFLPLFPISFLSISLSSYASLYLFNIILFSQPPLSSSSQFSSFRYVLEPQFKEDLI